MESEERLLLLLMLLKDCEYPGIVVGLFSSRTVKTALDKETLKLTEDIEELESAIKDKVIFLG